MRFSSSFLRLKLDVLYVARLAQSAERKALNLGVVGSSPTVGGSLAESLNQALWSSIIMNIMKSFQHNTIMFIVQQGPFLIDVAQHDRFPRRLKSEIKAPTVAFEPHGHKVNGPALCP